MENTSIAPDSIADSRAKVTLPFLFHNFLTDILNNEKLAEIDIVK